VKRSEALVTIPSLGLEIEVIVEAARRIILERNLIGRGLINKFILLLDGIKGENCIIRYQE